MTTISEQIFESGKKGYPGKSGFTIMPSGETAFRVRNSMIHISEKTLDVQYFEWESDKVGNIFINQLLEAASRGIHVRLLLDDVNNNGRDLGIASIDAYPNIEVRLFNPFSHRGSIYWGFLTDMSRVNHRMHNKAFIMDNTFAVVGGRNIGDQYFGVSSNHNFRDLDLFTTGPVVDEITASFNSFWNSKWTFPVSAVAKYSPSEKEVVSTRQKFGDRVVEYKKEFPYAIDKTHEEIHHLFTEIETKMIWAKAEVLYDDPEQKVGTLTEYQGIAPRLREILEQIKEEVLFESAYFIPQKRGIQTASRLRERGVRIQVLTNSMATNNVAGAFVGYRRYRKQLLENGIDLYELKLKTGTQRAFWSFLASDCAATLHSKLTVFDRKKVFIGSFNLDPRSIKLNTEIGLLIYSTELTQQVIEFMDTGIDPSNSYRLQLKKNNVLSRGKVTWISQENSIKTKIKHDPDAGFRRPVSSWFIALLHFLFPIEKHL